MPAAFSFKSSGSFKNTERFLRRAASLDIRSLVEPYAQEGVAALARTTPVDSGLASRSWGYKIINMKGSLVIEWTNTDIENGFPVAIRLEYGYGTGTGGYVAGRKYIQAAIEPIFARIAENVWKEVTR